MVANLCGDDVGERNRYRLLQFQKRNPQRYNTLTNELCSILNEMDEEMAATAMTDETHS